MYTSLILVGGFCVVFNTAQKVYKGMQFVVSAWEVDNNPKTAVAEFLKTNSDFVVNRAIEEKLLISAAPGGYRKRIK